MTMWEVFISEKTSSGPKCFSVAGQILAPGPYVWHAWVDFVDHSADEKNEN